MFTKKVRTKCHVLKAQPIFFSGPEVRAILNGSKTQARRIVKWQGPKGYPHSFENAVIDNPAGVKRLVVPYNHPSSPHDPWWDNGGHRHYCPYGDPPFNGEAEYLWVRETWGWSALASMPPSPQYLQFLQFKADVSQYFVVPSWKSPVSMPRWASRLTLEIVAVRVERLQNISEADAIAEGVEPVSSGPTRFTVKVEHGSLNAPTAVDVYRVLWDSIRGNGAWDKNPFVWVLGFKRLDME